jgi:putative ABC transport system substrate-binding protein
MNPKLLLWLLTAILLAPTRQADAQQPTKIPRIGYIATAGDIDNPGLIVQAFQQGLRDLGYIEGKNIIVEYRYPGTEPERLISSVPELIKLKVDVLITSSTAAIRAAKETTKTVPIVMIATFDPVKTGMAESLARPGGNITGVLRLTHELSGKRLELFKEAVPQISRIGIVAERASASLPEYERVARTVKVLLDPIDLVGSKLNLKSVFQPAIKRGVNGIITIASRSINHYTKEIIELALKNQLPTMFEISTRVSAGGLMSYSADDLAIFRRAAVYVDKILKGAKPGEMPIEQPTKFELVINLKTAKQLGLTIPPNVLARADKVIK